jgi:hypothetical protein
MEANNLGISEAAMASGTRRRLPGSPADPFGDRLLSFNRSVEDATQVIDSSSSLQVMSPRVGVCGVVRESLSVIFQAFNNLDLDAFRGCPKWTGKYCMT